MQIRFLAFSTEYSGGDNGFVISLFNSGMGPDFSNCYPFILTGIICLLVNKAFNYLSATLSSRATPAH